MTYMRLKANDTLFIDGEKFTVAFTAKWGSAHAITLLARDNGDNNIHHCMLMSDLQRLAEEGRVRIPYSENVSSMPDRKHPKGGRRRNTGSHPAQLH